MYLFAPNGDTDNSGYSPIENNAQEKLNYGGAKYSNKDGRSDVESTWQMTLLLLTNTGLRGQRPFRINALRRHCPLTIFCRSVSRPFTLGQASKVGLCQIGARNRLRARRCTAARPDPSKILAAMIMSGRRETSYMPPKASRAAAMSFNATP
jgi:hypothetical protein